MVSIGVLSPKQQPKGQKVKKTVTFKDQVPDESIVVPPLDKPAIPRINSKDCLRILCCLEVKRGIGIQNIASLFLFNTVMSLAFSVYNVQILSLFLNYQQSEAGDEEDFAVK
jgi:hypothetical protein